MYFVFNSAFSFFEINNRNHFITVDPLTFPQGECGGEGGEEGQFELGRSLDHIMISERWHVF